MPKAIIDTATRVIRCFTIDPAFVIQAGDTGIDIPDPIVYPASTSGFFKLNNQNKIVAATITEANTAGVNEVFNQQQAQARLLALRDAAIAMRDDAGNTATAVDFARKLIAYLRVQ